MGQTPDPRSPIRTCVGCRRRARAAELVRCRVTTDGRACAARVADRVGGRGAWICARSLACFEQAVRTGAFTRAWRQSVSVEALAELGFAFGSPNADMRQSRVAGTAGRPN